MSTVASIILYLAFCLWRWHQDRVAEGRRAEQDAEIIGGSPSDILAKTMLGIVAILKATMVFTLVQ